MYLQLLETLKLEGLPNNTTWFNWNEGPTLAEIVYKIDSLLIWAAACCTYGMASAAWCLLILVLLVYVTQVSCAPDYQPFQSTMACSNGL